MIIRLGTDPTITMLQSKDTSSRAIPDVQDTITLETDTKDPNKIYVSIGNCRVLIDSYRLLDAVRDVIWRKSNE